MSRWSANIFIRPGLKGLATALCLALALIPCHASAQTDAEWRTSRDGLEYRTVSLSTWPLFASSLTLIRGGPRYTLRVIRSSDFGERRSFVNSLCNKTKAAACINASFFDEQGKPLGILINRGTLFQKLQNGGDTLTAVLAASKDRVRIVHRSAFNPEGILEAVQAGPRLLANGEKITGLKLPLFTSNLSGICIDSSARTILYRVTTSYFGTSLEELQDILRDPQIGCLDAMNFDGGGSSQLYSALDGTNTIDLKGEDSVPVALGLFDS